MSRPDHAPRGRSGDQEADRWDILCLEGEWEHSLTDRKTVEPLVAYVASMTDCRYVHRRVRDAADLLALVDHWCSAPELAGFGLFYLAAHGEPGSLSLGGAEGEVTLDQLGHVIDGRGADRVLYVGSCSVLRDEDAIRRFTKRAGLRAVVGYTKYVDFVAGSAVDLLALHALNTYARVGDAVNHIGRQMPDLVDSMGFRAVRQ